MSSSIYAEDIKAMIIACNEGNETMCSIVGVKYTDGVGVDKNLSKGQFYIDKACELSNGFYCFAFALTDFEPQNKTEKAKEFYNKAYEKFTKSCDNGNVEGCSYLGEMYRIGAGVIEDKFKAFEFYTIACKGDYAEGCYYLGNMYFNGEGTRQNYLEASKAYIKSCNSKDATGCLKLGRMYEKGQGVKQDKIKAKELFGKSCDLKNNDGCKEYSKLNK